MTLRALPSPRSAQTAPRYPRALTLGFIALATGMGSAWGCGAAADAYDYSRDSGTDAEPDAGPDAASDAGLESGADVKLDAGSDGAATD